MAITADRLLSLPNPSFAMVSFEEILAREGLVKNPDVLSPHYVPENLLYREDLIETIMKELAPALKGKKIKNVFVYGKTGTGKTTSLKFIMQKFLEAKERLKTRANMFYMNCRIYNSRYRIFQNFLKVYFPEVDKPGYGLSHFYEKLIELLKRGERIILILDEVDAIKDIDELIYTLTRSNDDSKEGGLSIVGISNKLGFKSELDPRTRSSLYEKEVIFFPYDAKQLRGIILQRVKLGFKSGAVADNALSLIAAITAQENGDARYALKLLQNAADIAEKEGAELLEEKHVELARRQAEFDIAAEALKNLPLHQQLIVYALAKMSINKAKVKTLFEEVGDGYFFSGDLYNYYTKVCRALRKKPKSARSYRDYINELDNLGLISTTYTSKGIRGHTRLIKIGVNAEDATTIIEKQIGI